MLSLLGPLITGGSSLLGGLFGADAARSGAKRAARSQLKASMKNMRYQKEFAKHGIRWRVKDAEKAGIHPLAAVGAQTTSFSPSFVGAGDGGEAAAGASLAAGIAGMGQGVGRAVEAYADEQTRTANNAYLARMQKLQLENMSLQNAALASNIAMRTQPGHPPAMQSPSSRYLVDGQASSGSSNLVQDTPVTRLASDPDKQYQEAGAVTDKGWLRTQDGYAVTKSKDAMDRMDDDWWGSFTHAVRNRITPGFTGNLQASGPFKLRPGYYWMNNPITDNWWVTDGQGNEVKNYKP